MRDINQSAMDVFQFMVEHCVEARDLQDHLHTKLEVEPNSDRFFYVGSMQEVLLRLHIRLSRQGEISQKLRRENAVLNLDEGRGRHQRAIWEVFPNIRIDPQTLGNRKGDNKPRKEDQDWLQSKLTEMAQDYTSIVRYVQRIENSYDRRITKLEEDVAQLQREG